MHRSYTFLMNFIQVIKFLPKNKQKFVTGAIYKHSFTHTNRFYENFQSSCSWAQYHFHKKTYYA